jgi:D-glycero-alpha-D-manno-heptose-7-phosphate kinase
MIITKTPYRISLFGGGTDYNKWFEEKGGLIVGSTINRYCYISLRTLPNFFAHKSRVVYSKIEEVNGHSEIEHPAVRACLNYLDVNNEIELHHDGDLPARSGIGSSSSFTVGLLQAIHAYKNEMISKAALAKEAIHLEQKVMNENVGIQDQILASYGGMKIINMGPGDTYSVSPLILGKDYKKELQSHFMLAFSGVQRIASGHAGKQIQKIEEGALNAQLSEIHDIAKEGLNVLQKNQDIRKVGELFDRTWKVKRSLIQDMSTNAIDEMYETAMKKGAFGGRLLGAGAGGFMVFIAPPEKHEQIKNALASQVKVWVPFEFEDSGSQILFYDEH